MRIWFQRAQSWCGFILFRRLQKTSQVWNLHACGIMTNARRVPISVWGNFWEKRDTTLAKFELCTAVAEFLELWDCPSTSVLAQRSWFWLDRRGYLVCTFAGAHRLSVLWCKVKSWCVNVFDVVSHTINISAIANSDIICKSRQFTYISIVNIFIFLCVQCMTKKRRILRLCDSAYAKVTKNHWSIRIWNSCGNFTITNCKLKIFGRTAE